MHAERGYTEIDVDQIVTQADLSQSAFLEHFADKLDCIAAVQDDAWAALRAEMHSAWTSSQGWPTQVSAGVAAALDFASASPEFAAVLLPTSLLVEPALAGRIWAMNDFLAERLRAGRLQYPHANQPPAEIEHVLVGGVQAVIGAEIRAGRAAALPKLCAGITQAVLIPYLGPELARRFAHREAGAGQ